MQFTVINKRNNVLAKLRQLGAPKHTSKDILDSIFGYQLGDMFFKGLLDTDDAVDFKTKTEDKVTKHVLISTSDDFFIYDHPFILVQAWDFHHVPTVYNIQQ